MDPGATPPELMPRVDRALVGAVFTLRSLASRLPPGTSHVLLDDAPARATVVIGGRALDVTLTGHDALRLDGDPEATGSDKPCIEIPASLARPSPPLDRHTHRALLAAARTAMRSTMSFGRSALISSINDF